MSCACTVPLDSHWPHVATEPFGNATSAAKKFWFDLMLIHLNLDSHVCLRAPELCGPSLAQRLPPGAGPTCFPRAADCRAVVNPHATGTTTFPRTVLGDSTALSAF